MATKTPTTPPVESKTSAPPVEPSAPAEQPVEQPAPAPVVAPAPAVQPTRRAALPPNPLKLAHEAGEMWIINSSGRCVQVRRDTAELMIRQGQAVPAPIPRIAEELGVEESTIQPLLDAGAAATTTRKAAAMTFGAKRKSALVNICAEYEIEGDAGMSHQELVALLVEAVFAGRVPQTVLS